MACRLLTLCHPAVVSCLLLATIDADRVSYVLGTLSPALQNQLNDCLKAALGLP